MKYERMREKKEDVVYPVRPLPPEQTKKQEKRKKNHQINEQKRNKEQKHRTQNKEQRTKMKNRKQDHSEKKTYIPITQTSPYNVPPHLHISYIYRPTASTKKQQKRKNREMIHTNNGGMYI